MFSPLNCISGFPVLLNVLKEGRDDVEMVRGLFYPILETLHFLASSFKIDIVVENMLRQHDG